MNKILFYWGLSIAVALSLCGCNSGKNDELVHDHSHAKNDCVHNGENDGAHEENNDEITLDVHEAERLGVKTIPVKPSQFAEIVKVSGICEASPTDISVVSAQSSGILTLVPGINVGKQVTVGQTIGSISAKGMAGGDPNVNSAVAVETAKKELDRLTPLYEDGIVSARDYNAAEAEYKRALAASGAANSGSRVIARLSGIITQMNVSDGEYVEQGSTIATIAANSKFLVRADVPVRFSNMALATDCNLKFIGIDSIYSISDFKGHPVSKTQGRVVNGYIPVYFEIAGDGNVRDGMMVEVFLKGDPKEALTIPLSALTEQQGVYFVYERLDDDCYRKLPVIPGNNDGRNIEILSGLSEGQDIVTGGVIFVKLAENSGAVPEGHSHSH